MHTYAVYLYFAVPKKEVDDVDEDEEVKLENAAIKIQAGWKGYKVRRDLHQTEATK